MEKQKLLETSEQDVWVNLMKSVETVEFKD
jgi:hypothetical protein